MAEINLEQILDQVEGYYSQFVIKNGANPSGVDWNSKEGQYLRFDQLSKLINPSDFFSVNDLGCGYGAYYSYLQERKLNFQYFGTDISAHMIATGKSSYPEIADSFVQASFPKQVASFSIASGLLNVKAECSNQEWTLYTHEVIEILNRSSSRGFAFNCLTSYSDKDRMQDRLFYADPLYYFDFCKRKYSKEVALLHDYGLYEFTILVRK